MKASVTSRKQFEKKDVPSGGTNTELCAFLTWTLTPKVHHEVHRKPVIPLVYYMVMVKVTCAMSTNIGDAVIKEIKQVP